MKVISSILLMFIMAGCSHDELQPDTTTDLKLVYKKSGKHSNSKNPYTHVGVIYQEMLNSYYMLPQDASSIEEVIDRAEAIAFLNPGFMALNQNSSYRSFSADEITPYLGGEALEDLLSEDYTAHAVGIIMAIASELSYLKAQNQPFQDVEAYFMELDSEIANDNALGGLEKQALLTTTTIVCNALDNDRKRKRRDRDWEWMTTHLAATANASMESVPQAIMMSLTTDVY